MQRLVLALLRFYRRRISPALPPACRFAPTCSEYMLQAVDRFGATRGVYLGLRRLLRCHPFQRGGWDPVPARLPRSGDGVGFGKATKGTAS